MNNRRSPPHYEARLVCENKMYSYDRYPSVSISFYRRMKAYSLTLTLAPVHSACNLSPSCEDGVLLPVNHKKYTLIKLVLARLLLAVALG